MSIKGFSNQKGYGKSEFLSVQSAGSDRKGIPTAQMYLTDITAVAIAITAVTQSVDQKITYVDFGAAHGARIGDVLRMTSGALIRWEFEIIEIASSDIVGIYNLAPTLPQVADDAKICGWVTAKSDDQGGLVVSPGPVEFVQDGVPQTVTEDTAVPANNKPLPAGLYFYKDGVAIPVNKDTGTPANTAAIPVEIVSGSGTEINITAGDIDIHTTSEGVNYDSMRIGDGSGVFIAVNADGSANVVAEGKTLEVTGTGAILNATPIASTNVSKYRSGFLQITGVYNGTLAFQGSNDGVNWEVALGQSISSTSASASGGVTSATGMFWFPIQYKFFRVILSAYTSGTVTALMLFSANPSSDVGFRAVTISGVSSSANQLVEQGLLGALTEVAPASDTASSGLNGRLQRIAQRLTSLIALFPSSIGRKVTTDSLSVTLSSDHAALPLPTGASTESKQDAAAVLLGAVNETAPASDTASSGLNGRLQRVAQRITSLIALIPASLGAQLSAASFSVVLASDQAAVPVTQSAMVGSYQEDLTVSDAAVETFTAPAGAKWVKLQADELNTGNVRVKIGAAATTTSGFQLQPGRSEEFRAGGNVSYTMEASGSGKLYAQFGV